ncbi:hypothetical protein BHE74_00017349 [Ensete ventricosum]|nr:hypothetical protein BHE74_00017349 [Ensete ventricosum]
MAHSQLSPYHHCHRHCGHCPQPLMIFRRHQHLLPQYDRNRATSASSTTAAGHPLLATEVPLLLEPSPLLSPTIVCDIVALPCRYASVAALLLPSTITVPLSLCRNCPLLCSSRQPYDPITAILSPLLLLPSPLALAASLLPYCLSSLPVSSPASSSITVDSASSYRHSSHYCCPIYRRQQPISPPAVHTVTAITSVAAALFFLHRHC